MKSAGGNHAAGGREDSRLRIIQFGAVEHIAAAKTARDEDFSIGQECHRVAGPRGSQAAGRAQAGDVERVRRHGDVGIGGG